MTLLVDYFEQIAGALRFVAPSYAGKKWLADNTVAPPRFVWVRLGDRFSSPERTYVAYRKGEKIIDAMSSAEIHCWGKTESDCENLRILLLNAIHQNISKDYYAVGDAEWLESEHSQHGAVVKQQITFRCEIPHLHIPQFATDKMEKCFGEAVVRDIQFCVQGEDGDGILECGEEGEQV